MRYVGISTTPKARVKIWEEMGLIIFNFKIVKTGLSYEEALELEYSYRTMGYMAEPTTKVEELGKVFSVYTFEY